MIKTVGVRYMSYGDYARKGIILSVSLLSLTASVGAETVTVEAPAEDAAVYNREPDTNFGSIGTVTVHYYWQYSYPPRYRRTYCRWDLPSLPSGSTIVRAEAKFLTRNMSLHPYNRTPDIQCRPVTEAWQENTINWNNQPARGAVASTSRMEWEKTWYIFDVTSLTSDWYAGLMVNYGIGLNVEFDVDDPYSNYWATFYSREEANVDRRPKLVIEYSEVAVAPSSFGRVKALFR
jgi:hypothetical protein